MAIAVGNGRAGAKSDINVTPLVDVVLVLLIIFMVVTPLAQADLPLELPRTTAGGPNSPGTEQVLVSVDAAGGLRIDGAAVTAEQYLPRLREVLGRLPRGQRRLFFEADDGVNYAVLVAALDTARSAGAESLEVLTDAAPSPSR